MIRLVFIGAGPFHEQVEIVTDVNSVRSTYEIIGILDDEPGLRGSSVGGVPVLGPVLDARNLPDVKFVMGIGTNRSRTALADVIAAIELPHDRYETLIHPSAKIYSSAHVGFGSILHAGCIVGNGSAVGAFCKVIWNAVVGANNIIGVGVSLCPNSTTGFSCRIGDFSFVGSGAVVADGVTVGPMVKVGMGTVVTRDVAPGAFVFGNPARLIEGESVPGPIEESWRKRLEVEDGAH